jgi:CheY-like chemotaxis protein
MLMRRTPRFTVLVVEDDILTCTATADNLRAEGYRVLEAVDRPEALSWLQSDEHIDVVFADVHLGQHDARDFLRDIRRERKSLRVIFATGDRHAARQLQNEESVLVKPYSQTDLLACLAALRQVI